jgi:hypothetical protein
MNYCTSNPENPENPENLETDLREENEFLRKEVENANAMKIKIRQDTLLEQYNKNDQCVYYGIINNKSNDNEPLVKFGNSKDLRTRIATHQKTYDGFYLVNAFRVDNKFQIETEMKKHPLFQMYQRTIEINGKNYIELLAVDKLSFDELNKIIRTIIHSMSMVKTEKYNKLLERNERKEKVRAPFITPLIPVAYSCRINNENLVATFDCSSCDYRTENKRNYSNHMTSNMHKKNAYSCECCNYNTIHKNHYARHMLSTNHEMMMNAKKNKLKPNQCGQCLRQYSCRRSLSKHKCKGGIVNAENNETSNNDHDNISDSIANSAGANDDVIDVLKKQHDEIIKKNDEVINWIVSQNQEIATLINTIVTRGFSNNTNNSHNTNHTNSHN